MIYLDHNATTPVDPRVLEAMTPFFTEQFGNPASRHHAIGCDAAKTVERAREQVASVIGADQSLLIMQCDQIPHAKVKRSIELFGKEVIPAFKD